MAEPSKGLQGKSAGTSAKRTKTTSGTSAKRTKTTFGTGAKRRTTTARTGKTASRPRRAGKTEITKQRPGSGEMDTLIEVVEQTSRDDRLKSRNPATRAAAQQELTDRVALMADAVNTGTTALSTSRLKRIVQAQATATRSLLESFQRGPITARRDAKSAAAGSLSFDEVAAGLPEATPEEWQVLDGSSLPDTAAILERAAKFRLAPVDTDADFDSVEQIAALTNKKKATVRGWANEGRVYSIGGGTRGKVRRIAVWQFAGGHRTPVRGMPEVLEALLPAHPLAVREFFTTERDDLAGMTPMEWLRTGGDIDPVVLAAGERTMPL